MAMHMHLPVAMPMQTPLRVDGPAGVRTADHGPAFLQGVHGVAAGQHPQEGRPDASYARYPDMAAAPSAVAQHMAGAHGDSQGRGTIASGHSQGMAAGGLASVSTGMDQSPFARQATTLMMVPVALPGGGYAMTPMQVQLRPDGTQLAAADVAGLPPPGHPGREALGHPAEMPAAGQGQQHESAYGRGPADDRSEADRRSRFISEARSGPLPERDSPLAF